jgi:hypothetical protein
MFLLGRSNLSETCCDEKIALSSMTPPRNDKENSPPNNSFQNKPDDCKQWISNLVDNKT